MSCTPLASTSTSGRCVRAVCEQGSQAARLGDAWVSSLEVGVRLTVPPGRDLHKQPELWGPRKTLASAHVSLHVGGQGAPPASLFQAAQGRIQRSRSPVVAVAGGAVTFLSRAAL